MTLTINRDRQVETLLPIANGNGTLPATIPDVALTPMEMLASAVAQGAGIEVLKGLMELYERWDRQRAIKAFNNALADAKAELPVIVKNRHVGFDSKKEGAARTDYWHEDLAQIARTIDPILSKHGLSYRWRPTSGPNQPVTVTCIISHRDGHFEESMLQAGADTSGNKNSIQAIGSAVTFLQRYTLKAALGLSAAKDDDGHASDTQVITEAQVGEIQKLLDATKTDDRKFLDLIGERAIREIPATRFAVVVQPLRSKLRAQQGQKS